jgi:hypothetical protein
MSVATRPKILAQSPDVFRVDQSTAHQRIYHRELQVRRREILAKLAYEGVARVMSGLLFGLAKLI